MFKVGDEVSVKGEITKVCESGVVVKAHYFGEAYIDKSNMDLIGKTYEQGLADAWELAKKIFEMPHKDYVCMFGDILTSKMMEIFTAAEALAKIEAYEREKEIKVGDEVVGLSGYKAVVTGIGMNRVQVMFNDGSHTEWKLKEIKKTGKHIDIEGLLRQIGE